jgi:PAS domain S-box-containing protein
MDHIALPAIEYSDSAWTSDALRLLARAGRVLGASLEIGETLTDLGRLLVPELADAVIVQLLDPATAQPTAEFAHALAEQQAALDDYLEGFGPLARSGSLLTTVARTGTPIVLNHVTDGWLRNVLADDEQYRAFTGLGVTAAVGIPLIARRCSIGALTLLMTRSGRQFGPGARLLAEELAARAALAIDTGRLVEAERRAREALRESEAFLKFAQQAAAMGVWDYDPATGCARWSDECYHLFGRRPGPFVPSYEAWLACVHEDDRAAARRAVEESLAGGTEYRLEFRVRHPERGLRWLLEIGHTVRTGAATPRMTGVVLDITERKQTEERLRQAEKMESIGRLAGGLAHDFNNQLHALSGFATFVARDGGLAAQSRRDLLEIQNAADRMASLTHQLLTFSRQQVLAPETLDLNVAVADAQPMLQRLIGSNIEIRLELAPGPTWVRVDRAQLLQVLMNLAINARDAMPGGGGLVIRAGVRELRAEELDERNGTAVEPGTYAVLAVSDSGAGIAAEHLPHIFEPFYTTKDIGKGTGLGLATVHGIVRQSRGQILVETALGAGSTFTVLLPTSEPPEPTASARGAVSDAGGHRARVLVVDDEEMVRRLVARTLELEGYDVAEARHGGEALQVLEQAGGAVELVVSDVVMPVMGGLELGTQLRHRYPALPVIWMSGYPSDTAFANGGLPDDQPFLQKPVGADVLVGTVRRTIELSARGKPAS